MITRVSRTGLLDKLKSNRENHHSVYEKAYDAYSQALITELEGYLADAKNRKLVRIYSTLPVPEDHTDDYDAVIQLLEISLDDTIELDDQDVRRYVLDRWEWERSFAANTLRYTQPEGKKGR